MNIVRESARNLIIESPDLLKTFKAILKQFDCEFYLDRQELIFKDYLNLISIVDDQYTILMFTEEMKAKLAFENNDFKYIIAVPMDCEELLIELFKLKSTIDISNIRSTPRAIIMRATGDMNKYMMTVKKDVDGLEITKKNIFEKYSEGTFIFFTDESIVKPIGMDSFQETVVYSKEKTSLIRKKLNNNRVKYVNKSIDYKEWSELIIKIYDSYECYNLQYKRLTIVLEEMNCGLILGEGWGRDAALSFHSVGVYQLRLFTYLEPKTIKKIVLGLEYNQNGDRIVDYDLFVKRKKIYWTTLRKEKNQERDALGIYLRNELFKKLSEASKVKLYTLEYQIDKEHY